MNSFLELKKTPFLVKSLRKHFKYELFQIFEQSTAAIRERLALERREKIESSGTEKSWNDNNS